MAVMQTQLPLAGMVDRAVVLVVLKVIVVLLVLALKVMMVVLQIIRTAAVVVEAQERLVVMLLEVVRVLVVVEQQTIYLVLLLLTAAAAAEALMALMERQEVLVVVVLAVFDDMESAEKVKIYDKAAERRDYESYGDAITLRFGDVVMPHIDMVEPLKVECRHFAECVREGKRPRSDGRDGLRVVKVLDAAQRSLERDGEPVALV